MTVVAWFIRFIYYHPMAIKEAIFVARQRRATKIGFNFLK
jgi:hypothetical protein